MSFSTTEWIFEEVEHGEEVTRRHVLGYIVGMLSDITCCRGNTYHVVSEPSRYHRVVHDWLVWLLLEIAIPSTAEFGTRP